jgi:hypothetical protein
MHAIGILTFTLTYCIPRPRKNTSECVKCGRAQAWVYKVRVYSRQAKSSLPVHPIACMLWLTWKVCRLIVSFSQPSVPLTRIFHELLSRDHETGNPLAGLSGAQRARRRWVCHLATAGGWFPYLNGTSQEPTPEDARKDAHIRGRSK